MTKSGRTRWKAEREVALSKEETWFLRELVELSRKALPSDGTGFAARYMVDRVKEKLSKAWGW